MTELISLITPIALLDSLSMLPVCIVPIIILLTHERPVFHSSMFLLGLLVVYIPFGLLLILGVDIVFEAAGRLINEWFIEKHNGTQVLLQLVIGIALLALGYQIAKKHTQKLEEQPKVIVNARTAFTFAAILMLTGLWGALPYFAAIDQILRAELSSLQMVLSVLYYNLIFISPLVALVVIGIILGPEAKSLFEKLVAWLLHFGKRLITLALYLLGFILIVDAVGWYLNMPLFSINPAM